MAHSFDDLDQLAINTIRTLSIDAIERANSGHPGAPMALSPVAYLLFTRFLKHNPNNPAWPDRDRFVLSCGHASALLYSTLHLMGYDLSLEEIKRFRQWGSLTPGHPEIELVPGVEMTTGPLGQGCSTSVGMAIAEAHLGESFNRPGHKVVDHRTWVLCSDGDLMEGVSAEAASLAGHLKLEKLVWIWDDNRITIEGSTEIAFTEDVPARFRAYGWRVLETEDANDLEVLADVLDDAAAGDGRPTLVRVRSHIAWGSPSKQDSPSAHGSPLGAEEVRATKRAYRWPENEEFLIPPEVLDRCRKTASHGANLEKEWQEKFDAWSQVEPELAREWERRFEGRFPENWIEALPGFSADSKLATRAASGKVLNALSPVLKELIGGSADLAPSCKTMMSDSGEFQAGAWGERNLRFGIREHAMGSILNGLAVHGGLRPFGATFLVFSDYMRPAVRLAALMEQPVVFIFTHDSIWVGEDGPTHQPIEHVMALRSIPDLVVLRPADAEETAAAWRVALERHQGPSALILSRQGLPVLSDASEIVRAGVPLGAYVLAEVDQPQIVIVATGSEVSLAIEAQAQLAENGVSARVVSMPSWELFDAQTEEYRESVLPSEVPKLAVEAGITMGWHRWVGDDGAVIGIDKFGASAPGAEVAEHLGLSVEAVVTKAKEIVQ